MRSWAAFLVVSAALLAAAASAVAQNRVDAVLQKNDRNGDGRIGREEWQGPPPAFAKIDGDGDGYLSRAELEARLGGGRGAPAGGPASSPDPTAPPVEWIDVHTHPSNGGKGYDLDFSGSVSAAVKVLDDSPVSRIILMPTPQGQVRRGQWKLEDFLIHASSYPGRIAVMGGGGSLNLMITAESPDGKVSAELRERFEQRAEEILRLGAVGFGEISILHLSVTTGHSYHAVAGDHPLLLLLADIAARHDVPIDLHCDLVAEDVKLPKTLSSPPNPPVLKQNIDGLERLLAHNKQAKIVWAHAGSDNIGHWTVQLTRRMLTQYPNLYMSLRMLPGRSHNLRNHPLSQNGIKPGWLKLFRDFPDRFVIGGDQFFTTLKSRGPSAEFGKVAGTLRSRTALFLSYLPRDLARKIGYENAIRLYKLDR